MRILRIFPLLMYSVMICALLSPILNRMDFSKPDIVYREASVVGFKEITDFDYSSHNIYAYLVLEDDTCCFTDNNYTRNFFAEYSFEKPVNVKVGYDSDCRINGCNFIYYLEIDGTIIFDNSNGTPNALYVDSYGMVIIKLSLIVIPILIVGLSWFLRNE